MRCQDILDKIEARYPRKYACDWDNVGLSGWKPGAGSGYSLHCPGRY